jgi:hypothetical protein
MVVPREAPGAGSNLRTTDRILFERFVPQVNSVIGGYPMSIAPFAVSAIALIVLSACATVWEKPGMTQAELEADRKGCIQIANTKTDEEVRKRPTPSGIQGATHGVIYAGMDRVFWQGVFFKQCMRERGYISK